MIGHYRLGETVEALPEAAEADWLDLADPSEAELERVAERYGLDRELLAEVLDPKEHPRVERNETGLLIVVRVVADWRRPLPDAFRGTAPVGLLIQPGRLVSICREAGLVENLLKPVFGKRRPWSPLLLTGCLFRALGNGFVQALDMLEEEAAKAERSLRRRPENEALLDLLNIQKALIDLTVALKTDHGLLDKFHLSEPFDLKLSKIEKDVFEDAAIDIQQAVFTAEIFNQVLASMSDAFGSIISNNLNKIMKFLAGVTIVLMLPTIFAGLYGMNVLLPGADRESAFWLLTGFCLVLMLLVSIIFAKKNWF